ncbi:hypothetical protein HMPREF1583_00953 [Gardnerella vaginalis JCP8151B]|nr:hypothetical protein HMPREF1583_00953 [Gardnerella vaginalis JCP8151B]
MTSSLLTKSRRFEDESKRQRIFISSYLPILQNPKYFGKYAKYALFSLILSCKTQSTLENIR